MDRQVKQDRWRAVTLYFSIILMAYPFFLNGEPAFSNNKDTATAIFPLSTGWKFKFGDNPGYATINFNDDNWRSIQPGLSWEKQGFGDYDGTAWYRIKIPSEDLKSKKTLGVNLGKIDDADEAYFNGTLIGQTGKPFPGRIPRPDKTRIYKIPPHLVNHGKNVLAVRIFDTGGQGGIKGAVPLIGNFKELTESFNTSQFVPLVFVGLFFFAGLYSILFYLQMPDNREHLYFFLLSFLAGLFIAELSEFRFYIIDNYRFWNTIEILSGIALGPLLLRFHCVFYRLHETIFERPYYLYNALLAAVLILIVALTQTGLMPDNEYHDILVNYFWVPSLIFPLARMSRLFYRQIRRRNKNVMILTAATAVLVFSITNDLAIVQLEWIDGTRMLPYGVAFFIIGVATAIAAKYARLQQATKGLLRVPMVRMEIGADSPPVRINCFGMLEIFDADGLALSAEMIQKRKRFELLKILLVNFKRGVRKEEAAAMLWPGASFSQSISNLKSLLHRLRAIFSNSRVIVLENEHIRLNPEIVQTDFSLFEKLYDEAEDIIKSGNFDVGEKTLKEALDLYGGDFFDFDPNFELAISIRERLGQKRKLALLSLGKIYLFAERVEDLMDNARKILAIDDLEEEAWRFLLIGLALKGKRNEAMARYEDLKAKLMGELAVSPDPLTIELMKRIKLNYPESGLNGKAGLENADREISVHQLMRSLLGNIS